MTDGELIGFLRQHAAGLRYHDWDEEHEAAQKCEQAASRIKALTTALIKIREHNNTYGGSSYILRIIEAALEKQP